MILRIVRLAVDCIARYVDTNHDDIVTVAEVDSAVERYSGLFLKMLERLVSWEIDISTPKIMHDCGANDRGEFTEKEFLHGRASKTCMPTQQALCMFEVVCKHVAIMYEENEEQLKQPRVQHWW